MEKTSVPVTVIIPAYNAEKYITTAIDSVYKQEMEIEVIVIDDCSTDHTADVLKNYREYPGFRYLKNEKNSGVSFSRNRGVREAKGEYIAFLDADDWWCRGKLKAQLEALRNTGAVLCATGREIVRADASSTGKRISVKRYITYRELLKHNSINCSSVLLKTEVAREFPMENDEIHEDYMTWLKILKKYKYAVGVNEPYLMYRLSENGKSRNKLKSAKMTFQVYRCAGYGMLQSSCFFVSYAIHGVFKYVNT